MTRRLIRFEKCGSICVSRKHKYSCWWGLCQHHLPFITPSIWGKYYCHLWFSWDTGNQGSEGFSHFPMAMRLQAPIGNRCHEAEPLHFLRNLHIPPLPQAPGRHQQTSIQCLSVIWTCIRSMIYRGLSVLFSITGTGLMWNSMSENTLQAFLYCHPTLGQLSRTTSSLHWDIKVKDK